MHRFRGAIFAAAVALVACATGSTSGAPATLPPSGATLSGITWPVRTREHVDLWLHSYALLMRDTMHVPYFSRGYRDRVIAARKEKGVTTLLDTNRDKLAARIAVQPSLLTSGQFLPLYFPDWGTMRRAIDGFVGGGNMQSSDPATQLYAAVLANTFQSGADREWLRLFAQSVDDEGKKFYDDYWTRENHLRAETAARADSLWRTQWRPSLQRFLNNTQQQNGELYLSLPLGGEGRTVQLGKANNAIAVPLPDSVAVVDVVLYVVTHEIIGSIASSAITDNTTPADLRAGVGTQFEQNASVRAGAYLLQRTNPKAVDGYMRYYLRQAGMPVPMDPSGAFNSVFGLPETIKAAIQRQLDVILAGI